jgi:hypothetical protein
VCHNAQPKNSERRRRLREEKRRSFLCQQRDVCKAHYATQVRRRGVLCGMEDPAPPVPNSRGGLQWLRGKAKLSEGELPRAIVLCWFLKCFIGIVVSGSPPNVQEVFEVCWREARVWMLCMQLSCRVPSKRAKAFPSSQSAIVIACSSRFLGSGRVRGKAMPHTILNDAMRKSATL